MTITPPIIGVDLRCLLQVRYRTTYPKLEYFPFKGNARAIAFYQQIANGERTNHIRGFPIKRTKNNPEFAFSEEKFTGHKRQSSGLVILVVGDVDVPTVFISILGNQTFECNSLRV